MANESRLSDEARAELQEAIRIVREDRFESFVRSRLVPPSDEGDGKPKPPPAKPKNDPPPAPDGGKPDEGDGKPPARAGLWWNGADDD